MKKAYDGYHHSRSDGIAFRMMKITSYFDLDLELIFLTLVETIAYLTYSKQDSRHLIGSQPCSKSVLSTAVECQWKVVSETESNIEQNQVESCSCYSS